MKWLLFITFLTQGAWKYVGGTFPSDEECRRALEQKLKETQGIGWCRPEDDWPIIQVWYVDPTDEAST